MRTSLLAFIVLATLLVAAERSSGDATDDFVLAGQSNVVGSSTQNEDSKLGRVTSPSSTGLSSWSFRLTDHRWVLANEFPCDDSQCEGTDCRHPGPNRGVAVHPTWKDAGDGTCVCRCGVHVPSHNAGGDAGRGSPWPTFAARWMEEKGRSVRFVAAAIGSQTLVAPIRAAQPSWSPTAMDCATLPPVPVGASVPSLSAPGELYCRMLEAVALAGLERLRAVLWMQGESDAATVSGPVYRAALEQLADAIWADLGVPLIVAPLTAKSNPGDVCEASPEHLALRTAIVAAAAAHPRILLGPDADDLALEADCAHVHDVVSLGHRWYEAVSTALPEPDRTAGGAAVWLVLACFSRHRRRSRSALGDRPKMIRVARPNEGRGLRGPRHRRQLRCAPCAVATATARSRAWLASRRDARSSASHPGSLS